MTAGENHLDYLYIRAMIGNDKKQLDQEMSGEIPALTIIIPETRDVSHLRRLLTDLAGQDYPKDKTEILIVDSRTPSPLSALISEFSERIHGLRLLSCPSAHVSCARNLALKNSSAPYVLMLDERMGIESGRYLHEVVTTFLRSGADCVCRPGAYSASDNNFFSRAVALASDSFLGIGKSTDPPGEGEVTHSHCGAYYRRKVFDRVGAYDEAFDLCDDLDFNFRAAQGGCKRWFAPSLQVTRFAESSVSELWDRIFRLGAGRFLFGHKHKQFSLTHYLAPAGTLALALFAIFELLSGFSGPGAFELAFNTYAIFVLLTSALIILREKKLVYVFSLPVIFPVIHLALGSGFLSAWFRDWRSRQKPQTTGASAPAGPTDYTGA